MTDNRRRDIINAVMAMLPGENVVVQNVKKNNQMLTGIYISKQNHTSYVVYLERYEQDVRPMFEIADEICTILTAKMPEDEQQQVLNVLSFPREKIYLKVINKTWNEEMLKDRPWRQVSGAEDLAAVLYVLAEQTKEKLSIVNVVNQLVDEWGIDLNKLWDMALANSRRDFAPLLAPLGAMAGLADESPLHVLTNRSMMNGAACIMYAENELKDLAEKIGEQVLLLLPSSIHEFIVAPTSIYQPGFSHMIQTINQNNVSPDETLSDHPYLYNVSDGMILSLWD